jgi:hypothetical protein
MGWKMQTRMQMNEGEGKKMVDGRGYFLTKNAVNFVETSVFN